MSASGRNRLWSSSLKKINSKTDGRRAKYHSDKRISCLRVSATSLANRKETHGKKRQTTLPQLLLTRLVLAARLAATTRKRLTTSERKRNLIYCRGQSQNSHVQNAIIVGLINNDFLNFFCIIFKKKRNIKYKRYYS